MRHTPPTVPLVEQDGAIRRRSEQPAMPVRTAGTGPAVHDQRGLAVRIAARLPIDEVAVANVQHSLLVRFDVRKHSSHYARANASLRETAKMVLAECLKVVQQPIPPPAPSRAHCGFRAVRGHEGSRSGTPRSGPARAAGQSVRIRGHRKASRSRRRWRPTAGLSGPPA